MKNWVSMTDGSKRERPNDALLSFTQFHQQIIREKEKESKKHEALAKKYRLLHQLTMIEKLKGRLKSDPKGMRLLKELRNDLEEKMGISE